MNSSFFDRHSVRIPGYDYTTPGYYFITINSLQREPYFGQLEDENFHPSSIGERILDCWVKISKHFPNASCDAFTLMPDHFHGILELTAKSLYGHELQPYGHDLRVWARHTQTDNQTQIKRRLVGQSPVQYQQSSAPIKLQLPARLENLSGREGITNIS